MMGLLYLDLKNIGSEDWTATAGEHLLTPGHYDHDEDDGWYPGQPKASYLEVPARQRTNTAMEYIANWLRRHPDARLPSTELARMALGK